jgi:hypothetical protein
MSVDRHTIAAYIGAKDCPDLLSECLSRLAWVDEVLVADASSGNAVATMLATRYPRVKRVADVTEDHRMRLDRQIHNIDSEFVLAVDTDEFYTLQAAAEILASLRKPCPYEGFRIPSRSYVFGEPLGPGATQLRLFRKDRYSWPMKSPHEMPRVDGPVGVLTEPYHHHNSPSLSIVPVKTFRYEASHAALMDDADLRRVALDTMGPCAFWCSVIVEWARLNVRFCRALWSHRRRPFAGLCLAYGQVFQVIARHVSPTEERRMRSGVITRDRHGYL